MTPQDNAFLTALWNDLCQDSFALPKLIKQLRIDGNMSGYSDDAILQLFENRFEKDWSEVAGDFSELLAFYTAVTEADDVKAPQIVVWVFSVFVMRDAINNDGTDIYSQFDYIMDSFFYIRKKLESEESIYIMHSFFDGGIKFMPYLCELCKDNCQCSHSKDKA